MKSIPGHILNELPVEKLASFYTEGFGRPTIELYAVLEALILQQMHDLTDEETVTQFSFNLQWHYALDIAGDWTLHAAPSGGHNSYPSRMQRAYHPRLRRRRYEPE